MSNQLTKEAAARRKAENPYSLGNALKNGGPMVWLSCLIMGLTHMLNGQLIHGLLYLAVELAIVVFLVLPQGGIHWISMLPSLGWREQGEIWDEAKGVYVYSQGDKSQLILLYGIASIIIVVALVLFWKAAVSGGYKTMCLKKEGKPVPTFKESLSTLLEEKIHVLLMTPPSVCLLIFTVLPLLYMMSMAFTNYSIIDEKLILFDWVGLKNFVSIFDTGSAIGSQFWSVLGWTLIWAFFATFLNFFFGTVVALIINQNITKIKGFWRGCLSLTIAVPQFVSLLIIKTMFQPDGIVNKMLFQWGFLEAGQKLPFLTDATWARVLVIVINLWVGIPYTIMQVTGILKNIPAEQYEAAKIDGANVFQTFAHITIPYMIFVMTPYLITQFTGNINNFNVIYLLTGGAPTAVGNTAGATDLLVTWLYKLSVDKQQYNLAAVIGIFTFVVLSIVSLVTYRSSGSYKDEEGFK